MELDHWPILLNPKMQCYENVSLVADCFDASINYSDIFGYWPWTFLDEQQWTTYSEATKLIDSFHFVIVPAYLTVVRHLGILGSMLILFSTFGEGSSRQFFFIKYLRVVSSADFCYNFLGQVYNYMLHKHKHGYNEAMAYVMFLLPGIIAYCSTINEANTLFLICERYVSVCHPLFWNTVSMESKYRMFLGSFLSSFVVTTVRLTYFGTVRIERLPYNLTTDDLYHVVHRERLDSAAFEVWMNFNDIFIPTMFLVVMLYATVSMCLVIRRRNQVKVQPNSTTLTSGHCGSESRSTTESRKATHLMLATAITFSMSQITWLSLKVSHMVDFDKSPITLSSTRAEIQIWFKLYILHNVSSIACTIFESAYHAVNFYSYILFNRRFRIELKQKLKKLLRI